MPSFCLSPRVALTSATEFTAEHHHGWLLSDRPYREIPEAHRVVDSSSSSNSVEATGSVTDSRSSEATVELFGNELMRECCHVQSCPCTHWNFFLRSERPSGILWCGEQAFESPSKGLQRPEDVRQNAQETIRQTRLRCQR